MNARRRFLLAALLLAALMTGPFLLAAATLALDLKPAERDAIIALLRPHLPLGLLLTVTGFGGGMLLLHRLFQHYVTGLGRMSEELRLMQSGNRDFRLALSGPPEVQALAQASNALAEQRNAVLGELDARIVAARASVEDERNRLVTLMSQLFVGIVVCNREGRVVLYNRRAPLLLHGLPGLAGEVHFGLGRPITDLLHAGMVSHACAGLAARVATGATDPSARFLTSSRSGLLLDVRLAPVLGRAAPESAARIDGHVFTLDNADTLPTSRNDWLAADLLSMARRRLESALPALLQYAADNGADWVCTDAAALLDVLCFIACHLVETHDLDTMHLGLQRPGDDVAVTLSWNDTALSGETMHALLFAPVTASPGGASHHVGDAPALRDVLARAGAEFHYLRHSGRQAASVQLRLPRLQQAADVSVNHPPLAETLMPDFDFSLFDVELDAGSGQLDRPLSALAATVFDTETSGLDPAADAIIQLGAVRIVNGRLLTQETFNRLVDPERSLSAQNSAIHGITDDQLRGCPTIANVLPAFHRFCADTVLIGHNAAFDLQFLKAQETRCGLAFSQPVLDTLLLSAVIHPNLDGHSLEAIAARLGIRLGERHNALADARLTGEIFLKMLPLLADLGITTLRQAIAASERTPFAKLKY